MRELTMEETRWVSGGANNKTGSSWWDGFVSDVESFMSSVGNDISSFSGAAESFFASYRVSVTIGVSDGANGQPQYYTFKSSGSGTFTDTVHAIPKN